MRSYLIVANQTLTSESLQQAIRARLVDGPIETYVVVPLTPVGGRLTWDEQASWDVAKARLDDVLARLREMGADADGEVGDRDPVAAVRDAMRGRTVDEVIVSTLPKGISRWLGEDVPSRLQEAVQVPITVVTQAELVAQAKSRPPSRTSSIHGRSRPMVVAGPWPGNTPRWFSSAGEARDRGDHRVRGRRPAGRLGPTRRRIACRR